MLAWYAALLLLFDSNAQETMCLPGFGGLPMRQNGREMPPPPPLMQHLDSLPALPIEEILATGTASYFYAFSTPLLSEPMQDS